MTDEGVTGIRPPEIGAVIANRFELLERIGQGGMGAVFLARNLVTGKRVAIKWMLAPSSRAEHTERFIREARAAGRVQNPGVLDVYDVGEHDGALFLVMELLRGRSLADVIRQGPCAPGALLHRLMPALRGLGAAHRQGVIHRDLKPANIFFCEDDLGRPVGSKILDFGISKIVHPEDPAGGGTLTVTGAVMGTPHYMSPEQLDESRSVDARSDIYAVGVILYYALSGRLPYEANSYSTIVLKIAGETPAPLAELVPDVPPGLAAVVERALQKDPGRRYADVPALIRALTPFADPDAVLHGEAPASVPPGSGADEDATPFASVRHRVGRPSRVRGAWRWVAALGGLSLLGAVSLSLRTLAPTADGATSSTAHAAPSSGVGRSDLPPAPTGRQSVKVVEGTTSADTSAAPVESARGVRPRATMASTGSSSGGSSGVRAKPTPGALEAPNWSPVHAAQASGRQQRPAAPPPSAPRASGARPRVKLSADEF